MRINQKRDDFEKSDKVTTLHGCCCCCCCCCFFWPGGLIGAAVGSSYTSMSWKEASENEVTRPYLITARKIFWLTVVVIALIAGLLGIYQEFVRDGFLADNSGVLIAILVVPAPLLHFLIAALVTASMIRERIPDPVVRKLINQRNTHIVLGTLLGYAIGWGVTLIVLVN